MADQISDIPKKVANAASNAAESTKKMNFAEQLSSIGNKMDLKDEFNDFKNFASNNKNYNEYKGKTSDIYDRIEQFYKDNFEIEVSLFKDKYWRALSKFTG